VIPSSSNHSTDLIVRVKIRHLTLPGSAQLLSKVRDACYLLSTHQASTASPQTANPPFGILSPMLQHIIRCQATATVTRPGMARSTLVASTSTHTAIKLPFFPKSQTFWRNLFCCQGPQAPPPHGRKVLDIDASIHIPISELTTAPSAEKMHKCSDEISHLSVALSWPLKMQHVKTHIVTLSLLISNIPQSHSIIIRNCRKQFPVAGEWTILYSIFVTFHLHNTIGWHTVTGCCDDGWCWCRWSCRVSG